MFPLKDTVPGIRKPYITFILIGVNVAVYIYELIVGDSNLNSLFFQFGLIPARFTNSLYIGQFNSVFASAPSPIITLFSAVFLHGGWSHIIGNMWILWIFGDNVEDRLGHFRFLIFYILCGLAGNLFFFLSSPFSKIPMIGASGAIAGIMGAYILLFPMARVITLFLIIIFPYIVAIPAFIYLGLWFGLQFLNGTTSLLSGFNGGGVAYWAHIGGFLFGMFGFRFFIGKFDYKTENTLEG